MTAKQKPSTLSAWLQASRLQSQSYIFIPILLGQAAYFHISGEINWTIFVVLHMFGLFNQLFIVYANDYADYETDLQNSTYNIFSGGSRVLVEGLLKPEQLKHGAQLMALLCMLSGLFLYLKFERSAAVPLILLGLILLWAYSYRPIRLSYRGGGEFLQMLGVGLVLPLYSFYAQAGSLAEFPVALILSLLPIQLACAISTSLADRPSDSASNKRTASVLLGLSGAKSAIIVLCLISVALLLYLNATGIIEVPIIWVVLVPLLTIALHFQVFRSEPGSAGLLRFNMMTVVAVLTLQAGLIIAFFV